MKRAIVPLLLGLLVTLTACNSAVDKPTDSPAPPPAATAPAVPTASAPQPTTTPVDAPVWESQAGSCSFEDADGTILVQGEFSLPRIQNAGGIAAYTSINRWYEQLLSDLKSDTMANAAQAQDDYATSQALGDPFAGYSDEETHEITHQDDKTVSVLRTHYGYTSGPYPTLLYMADRFDLTTGALLKFENFFTDPANAEEIVRAEIVRQVAGRADYDQKSVASAFNREYFYLTAEGFVFYYQPGILNSDASVKPEFLVGYDLMEGQLTR